MRLERLDVPGSALSLGTQSLLEQRGSPASACNVSSLFPAPHLVQMLPSEKRLPQDEQMQAFLPQSDLRLPGKKMCISVKSCIKK